MYVPAASLKVFYNLGYKVQMSLPAPVTWPLNCYEPTELQIPLTVYIIWLPVFYLNLEAVYSLAFLPDTSCLLYSVNETCVM